MSELTPLKPFEIVDLQQSLQILQIDDKELVSAYYENVKHRGITLSDIERALKQDIAHYTEDELKVDRKFVELQASLRESNRPQSQRPTFKPPATKGKQSVYYNGRFHAVQLIYTTIKRAFCVNDKAALFYAAHCYVYNKQITEQKKSFIERTIKDSKHGADLPAFVLEAYYLLKIRESNGK